MCVGGVLGALVGSKYLARLGVRVVVLRIQYEGLCV